jgi:hypothetical protein
MILKNHSRLLVRQRYEIGEFLGFETRNKYEILDEHMQLIGYAAEQSTGWFGFIIRQFLGHWRIFDIIIFDTNRQYLLKAHHPFRFFFQRLEIYDVMNKHLGSLQQRFSIFSKRFDVQNDLNVPIMTVNSPLWRFWTFPIVRHGHQIGLIAKKWSGLFSEALTDRDNFIVDMSDPQTSEKERQLILAAAIFVDLQYFERRAKD